MFYSFIMAARIHPIEGNIEDESVSLSSESEVPPPATKRTRGQLDATNVNRRKVISGKYSERARHLPPLSTSHLLRDRPFVVHIPEGSLEGTFDELQFVQPHQRASS